MPCVLLIVGSWFQLSENGLWDKPDLNRDDAVLRWVLVVGWGALPSLVIAAIAVRAAIRR